MTKPRRTRGSLFGLAAAIGLATLAPSVAPADDVSNDLEDLVASMTGTFSNAVQSAEYPEFFDLSLHMVPIWPEQTDPHWLYVEQAMSEHQDRPYRQRVYHVAEVAPGLFEIRIFTLPNPTAVVGVWLGEAPLAHLSPEDLEERDGCAILLRRIDESFVGSTLATLCTSSLRGASYATSEVVVTPDGMVSWDRGFAADGNQVWGSINGGFVFDRIVPDDEFVDSDSEQVEQTAGEVKPEPVTETE